MRLLVTSQDREKCIVLTGYLTNLGITNHLEMSSEQDWGSDEYGIADYHIWVIDEDEFGKAQGIANAFFANPEAPEYHEKKNISPTLPITDLFTHNAEPSTERKKSPARPIPWRKEPIGLFTLYFLIGCSALFFLTDFTAPTIKETPSPSLPAIPIYYSHIKKSLLFDYPEAYTIIDKLVNAFGIEKLHDLNDLPKEGTTLLNQYYNTPYWKGYYEEAERYLKDPESYTPSNAPMFEKIRQGEFWRLFTPSMLHGDIFHILFNMMWLAVMGRQLEQRMGRWRYLLFILFTGIITNIVQYLTGGPNFLGFSAILCAMLTFVWVRQRRFPWEGYQLERSTFGFLMFFLFTMLAIQLTSFYTEVTFGQAIAPPIANSAHMTGLALGYFLGHLNLFAWK